MILADLPVACQIIFINNHRLKSLAIRPFSWVSNLHVWSGLCACFRWEQSPYSEYWVSKQRKRKRQMPSFSLTLLWVGACMAYRTTHNIIYFYFLTDQFRIPTRNTYVFFSVANNLRIMWKQNILLMQNCSYFIFQLFGECWAKFHQIKNTNCTTGFRSLHWKPVVLRY